MLGIMGNIDQQVNDKADSMQMQGKTSTVSKNLLDVMATQKIAREKDTALKELQMAQQQNPNTIKDQLEQKVMGMTQNEMTNQTAGIMAQRQQQKQQRPQQRPPQPGGIAGARPPMGGAPRPPMGGAPRPPMGGAPKPPMGGMPQGGIAGAAPRPPMMASGGIVGFREGGQPKGRKRDYAEINRMSRQNEANQRARFGKNEEIRKIRQAFQRGEISAQKMQADIDAVNARVTPAVSTTTPKGGISAAEMADIDAQIAAQEAQKVKDGPQTFTVDQAKSYVRDQYNQMADNDTAVDTTVDNTADTTTTTTTATPTGGPEAGGVASLSQMAQDLSKQSIMPTQAQMDTLNATDPETGKGRTAVSDRVREIAPAAMDAIKQGANIRPEEARATARSAATRRMLPKGTREGSLGGLKQLQDKQLAEKQRQAGLGSGGEDFLRQQRLQNFYAQSGRRGRASRDQFNREASSRLGARGMAIEQYQDRYKKRFEALKEIDAQTNKVVDQAIADRNAMITASIDLGGADQEAYGKQIDQLLTQNQAAIQNQFNALGILSEAEMTAAAEKGASMQYFSNQLLAIEKAQEKLQLDMINSMGEIFKNLPEDDPQKIEGLSRIKIASAAAFNGPRDVALEAVAVALPGNRDPQEVKDTYMASRKQADELGLMNIFGTQKAEDQDTKYLAN
jgi:hypothetical protein